MIETLPKYDIVIATFVTPWVYSSGDVTGVEQFEKLINQLLKEDSFLLSIDPKSVTNSVRSWLLTKINLDNVYMGNLKLTLHKDCNYTNESVRWTAWRKKGGGKVESHGL